MADQCNHCGNFQNLRNCEQCEMILCSNCLSTHVPFCKDMQMRKARGDGQTVRRVNTLPEPKVELPKPELHPVVDPIWEAVVAGLPESEPDWKKKIGEVTEDPTTGSQFTNVGPEGGVIASLAGPAVTPEPSEDPFVAVPSYHTGDVVETERGIETISEVTQNEIPIQSISESVSEPEQNADAPSVVEGSTDGNGSDSVPATDDSGHVSGASGDSGNAPSAPEPEVKQ